MTKSGFRPIEHNDESVRLVIFHQSEKHGGEAIHSIGHLAACV